MMNKSNFPKILIVDGLVKNISILENAIQSLSVQLIKAESEEDALASIKEHEFALIIIEAEQSRANGYHIIETISHTEKNRYTPIIVIANNTLNEQDKLKSYQHGIVDYLHYPIDDIILLSKIKVFLDLYESRTKYQHLLHDFQLIFDAAGEGIFGSNLEGIITFMNPAAEKILGYTTERLIGRPLSTILLPESNTSPSTDATKRAHWDEQDIYTTCKNGATFHQSSTFFIKQDGTTVPVEFSAAPLRNTQNEYNGVFFVFSDISLRKVIEEQLAHLALYDPLTQLPNRLSFERILNKSLAQTRRHNKQMGLLFLDLDYFKNINERLGHDVGDLLLKNVAERLTHCVRKKDTVARLGGDEFAIVLDEISAATDSKIIAEKIINVLKAPFHLAGNEVFISVSIGLAIYPTGGENALSLRKSADIAMYQAKQSGRNKYCIFTDSMNNEIRLKLELLNDLRYAIERNELELYYQPKFKLSDNSFAGVEALIRWNHPELGFLLPADFVQAAEETQLIHTIAPWVVNKACEMAQKLKALTTLTTKPCKIAINLSISQLMHEELIPTFQDALKKYDVDPTTLEVELTETLLMTDISKSSVVISKLHDMGITVAIDDFGTGYSSLNYLKQLSIDSIKMDKTFVSSITKEMRDADIIKAIIGLAHNLNLPVIAEGVETEAQLNFLREQGCDYAQGYFLSYPLSERDIIKFIEKYKAS